MSIAKELAEARIKGYVVARENAHGRSLARDWWHECERDRRPYLRVTPRQTWAAVRCDIGPVGRRLGDGEADRLERAILDVWPDAARCGHLGVGSVTIVDSVPLALAEPLAARLRAALAKG